MNFISLLALLSFAALAVQLTRFWPRLAFLVILLFTALLVPNLANASANSLDVFSVSLALEPAPRDFITLALALTGALALAMTFQTERAGLAFLFWSWPAWLIAVEVNNFVVAVFAWALGLIAPVLAMQPRRFQRASGAAHYLVLIIVATASLLLANRFMELYPFTPERTTLIQLSVLFLSWGLGLLLALVPFHLWVGPMADEAPLPVIAAILGFGQPVGLWLLFRLLSEYLWLTEKSNLFSLITFAGAAAILLGGFMATVEQRAGRLLGYAAIFTLGFVMLDLGRGTREGLAYAGVELASRAISLTLFAVAIVVGRSSTNRWVRRLAVTAFLLAGFNLLGLRLGVGFSERWNLLLVIASTDVRLLFLVIAAEVGLLIGILRFAENWLRALMPLPESSAVPPAPPEESVPPEPSGAAEIISRPARRKYPYLERGNGADADAVFDQSEFLLGPEARAEMEFQTAPVEIDQEVVELSGAEEPASELESRDSETPVEENTLDTNTNAAESIASTETNVAEPASEQLEATEAERAAAEGSAEKEAKLTSEDDDAYAFEKHMGEIFSNASRRANAWLSRVGARLRPPARRVAHALPSGAFRFVLAVRDLLWLVWRSWRVWTGIALVASLTAILIIAGLTPAVWFERALASFGQPPFAR